MRRGLTLVELLVTITVLSVAALLVIPSMSQTGVLRIQAAVRTITSDIAFAQTEAMAFQSRRGIYFGVTPVDEAGTAFASGNGYVVCEPTGSELTTDNVQQYMLYLPEDPSKPFARTFDNEMLYGGAEIESAEFDGGSALFFDELGGPLAALDSTEPGSGGVIRIVAEDFGLEYELTVEAMTGRVDVNRVDDDAPEEDEGGDGGGDDSGFDVEDHDAET
ncbi:MAG: prepilin-type N-terminal cleavage/methylation domain-containing protein [Planctomycetota bacterium]